MQPAPTLRVERALLRDRARLLACMDEVGRGALCGPVTIGVVVIDAAIKPAPRGVKDSKVLTPEKRASLRPLVENWALAHAVGHASATEIDEVGIIAALRLAGQRALAALPVAPDHVLLDGHHDYLTPPAQPSLFSDDLVSEDVAARAFPAVTTMIKADMKCAAVAAASILAKTARDAIMIDLAEQHPAYGWAENKGYAAPEHREALARLGPTPYHRVSWNLPGQETDTVRADPLVAG